MNTKSLALLGITSMISVAAHAQDAARGQKLFEECAACHSTEGGVNGTGPSLKGALGRKAGENPDFRYSPAMRRSGVTWSAATLNEFISDPQKFVPDNRMPYGGMPDDKNRADLIAFLQQQLK